jgi:pimeloyl-ACP methyl ester carboxylesterase
MRRFGQIALAILAAFTIALTAGSAGAAEAKAKASDVPPIYIMRGGLNIFSTGMDVLAKELTDKGFPAISDGFMDWRTEMAKVIAAYKAHPYPIILVGHSYGAETALLMAYKLRDASVPIALLVFFDLTSSGKVPSNVAHVLNFRSSSSTGIDVTVTGGFGFSGTIDNVTRPDLNHLNVDKAEDLHEQAIQAIAKLLGKPTKTAKEPTKTAKE